MKWILNISLSNYLGPDCGKPDLGATLSEIKNDGFGAELWMNWTPDKAVFDRRNWPDIKKWVAGCKSLTIHSECGNKDFEGIKKEIELAAYLKAGLLIVHVLNFGVVEAEEKLDIDEEYFGEVLGLAEKNKVILALENGRFELLKNFLNLAGGSRNLGICLDIGHANLPASSGLPENCPDPIEVFIREFSHRLIHFHVHDNFGREDNHLIPGRGNINWKQVARHLGELDRRPSCAALEIRSNLADARKSYLGARDFLNGL